MGDISPTFGISITGNLGISIEGILEASLIRSLSCSKFFFKVSDTISKFVIAMTFYSMLLHITM